MYRFCIYTGKLAASLIKCIRERAARNHIYEERAYEWTRGRYINGSILYTAFEALPICVWAAQKRYINGVYSVVMAGRCVELRCAIIYEAEQTEVFFIIRILRNP